MYATIIEQPRFTRHDTTASRFAAILARDAAERESREDEELEFAEVINATADSSLARPNWIAVFHYPHQILQTFSPGEGRSLVTNQLASGRYGQRKYHRNIGSI